MHLPQPHTMKRNLRWIMALFGICLLVGASAVAQTGPFPFQSRKTNKYGFHTGKRILIPARYDSVRHFSDGLAGVRVEGRWGFVDSQGQMVILPQLSDTYGFADGYAPAAIAGQWGLMDRQGKWVILPQYKSVWHVNHGLVRVETESGWGALDLKGRWVIQPQYSFLGELVEGRRQACDTEHHWGFLDASGGAAIPFRYGSGGRFSGGMAAARAEGENLYGYIDLDGSWVLMPRYHLALDFEGDYAVVREAKAGLEFLELQGWYGVIDRAGKYVISPEHDDITDCRNGWFMVEDDGKFFFQRMSDPILREGFDGANSFHEGYAFVCQGCKLQDGPDGAAFVGGEWALMDTMGTLHPLRKVKWQSDFPLNERNVIFERRVYRQQHALWLRREK